jgi:hypothetical protein
MKTEVVRVREEVLEYFKSLELHNPFAVTLTMVERAYRDIRQNFRHFMNRLNKRYIGKSFQRHNNKLTVIPIIEGENISHIHTHYHALIDNPYDGRDEEFAKAIEESWAKTTLGRNSLYTPHSVVIEKVRDDGWLEYMMKHQTKSNFYDSIDWQNVHRR